MESSIKRKEVSQDFIIDMLKKIFTNLKKTEIKLTDLTPPSSKESGYTAKKAEWAKSSKVWHAAC